MSARGTRMLRFDSEADLHAARQRNRERFQRGEIAIPEREILAACLELLRKHPAIAMCWRVNTGCGYILDAKQYHSLVNAGHLKPGAARFIRFSFKGCSDILGVSRDGKLVAIETKADRGVVTDEQQAFIDSAKSAGAIAGIARSVTEAMEIVGAAC